MTNYFISLGCGVQSAAMVALAEQKKITVPQAAIFADTGDEPSWTYDFLEKMRKREKWVSIHTCQSHYGSLSQFTQNKRFISAPVFSTDDKEKKSMGQRQCTFLFKVYPVYNKIRELTKTVRKRLPKGHFKVMLGISTDEEHRRKPAQKQWVQNVFPLMELGLSREDCKQICLDFYGEIPKKSSCTFCPYKSRSDFYDMKINHPEDFKKAVEFDEMIRDLQPKRKNYVLRDRIPLEDLKRPKKQLDLFHYHACDAGHCGL